MFTALPILIPILALGGMVACVVTTVFSLCTHVVLGRRRFPGVSCPGITILKPLKGLDDELESNLASLVDQDYDGPFEVLLGAADPDDPALEVARRVQRRFPDRDVRIVAGHGAAGINPKVANLAALSKHARYDAWLVSDSNVRVGPDYLEALASELDDPRVGVISNPVMGVGGSSLGSLLENLHLDSFVIAAVCGAEVIANHPVVIGKSMLVRRAALTSVGGWGRFADILGEDYVLAAVVAHAGHRIVLSPYVVQTVNRTWTVDRFVSRHLRWAQVRRSIAPAVYGLEPLLHPLPWLFALAMALMLAGEATTESLAALAVLALGKIALDAVVLVRLTKRPPSVRELLAVPLKDAFVFGMWVSAWFRDTVEWRGRRFRIGRGSRLIDARRPATPSLTSGWTPKAHSSNPPLASAPDRR